MIDLKQMDLEAGDIIEIMYRSADDKTCWLTGKVICCDGQAWPLARLADGQLTEVRPFMTWRHLRKAARPRAA